MRTCPAVFSPSRSTDESNSALAAVPDIASITQLGIRLRVLVPESIAEPLALVDTTLANAALHAQTAIVPPSLEDVFVAATLEKPDTELAA